jgi:hypothetical protein
LACFDSRQYYERRPRRIDMVGESCRSLKARLLQQQAELKERKLQQD